MNVTIEEPVEAGLGALAISSLFWVWALRPRQGLPGVRVRSIGIGSDADGCHCSDGIVSKSNDREEGIA